jgi:hypothetical protein
MINGIRKTGNHLIRLVLFDAGYQNHVFVIFHFIDNADHLACCFALPENDFRKPFAQRSVMIDMGVLNVLIG